MNRIKDLREDNDITQKELAEKLNIAKSTLSGYENETSEPSFAILFKIADFFNVSIDYILGRTNDKANDTFLKNLTEQEIIEIKRYKELLELRRTLQEKKQQKNGK